MKHIAVLIAIIILTTAGIASASENTIISSEILNAEFGTHLGSVSNMNSDGESGVFVYDAAGNTVFAWLEQDVKAASFELTNRYLVASDDSGQALYELPDGTRQLQFTTNSGTIDFSMLHNSATAISTSIELSEDVLLEQSSDGLFSLYLMTTGELRVTMGPDGDGTSYNVTFTGIPGLNVKLDSVPG